MVSHCLSSSVTYTSVQAVNTEKEKDPSSQLKLTVRGGCSLDDRVRHLSRELESSSTEDQERAKAQGFWAKVQERMEREEEVTVYASDVENFENIVLPGRLTLVLDGDFTNFKGASLEAKGGLRIQARKVHNVAGRILSQEKLTIEADTIENSGGGITGYGNLTLITPSLQNYKGELSSLDGETRYLGGQFGILENEYGVIRGKRKVLLKPDDLATTVMPSGIHVINDFGKVESEGIVDLQVGLVKNNRGLILGSEIQADANYWDNLYGQILGENRIKITSAGSFDNELGKIMSKKGSLEVDIKGVFQNRQGNLHALERAVILSKSFLNQGDLSNDEEQKGQIWVSKGHLEIETGENQYHQGLVYAADGIWLTSTQGNLDSKNAFFISPEKTINLTSEGEVGVKDESSRWECSQTFVEAPNGQVDLYRTNVRSGLKVVAGKDLLVEEVYQHSNANGVNLDSKGVSCLKNSVLNAKGVWINGSASAYLNKVLVTAGGSNFEVLAGSDQSVDLQGVRVHNADRVLLAGINEENEIKKVSTLAVKNSKISSELSIRYAADKYSDLNSNYIVRNGDFEGSADEIDSVATYVESKGHQRYQFLKANFEHSDFSSHNSSLSFDGKDSLSVDETHFRAKENLTINADKQNLKDSTLKSITGSVFQKFALSLNEKSVRSDAIFGSVFLHGEEADISLLGSKLFSQEGRVQILSNGAKLDLVETVVKAGKGSLIKSASDLDLSSSEIGGEAVVEAGGFIRASGFKGKGTDFSFFAGKDLILNDSAFNVQNLRLHAEEGEISIPRGEVDARESFSFESQGTITVSDADLRAAGKAIIKTDSALLGQNMELHAASFLLEADQTSSLVDAKISSSLHGSFVNKHGGLDLHKAKVTGLSLEVIADSDVLLTNSIVESKKALSVSSKQGALDVTAAKLESSAGAIQLEAENGRLTVLNGALINADRELILKAKFFGLENSTVKAKGDLFLSGEDLTLSHSTLCSEERDITLCSVEAHIDDSVEYTAGKGSVVKIAEGSLQEVNDTIKSRIIQKQADSLYISETDEQANEAIIAKSATSLYRSKGERNTEGYVIDHSDQVLLQRNTKTKADILRSTAKNELWSLGGEVHARKAEVISETMKIIDLNMTSDTAMFKGTKLEMSRSSLQNSVTTLSTSGDLELSTTKFSGDIGLAGKNMDLSDLEFERGEVVTQAQGDIHLSRVKHKESEETIYRALGNLTVDDLEVDGESLTVEASKVSLRDLKSKSRRTLVSADSDLEAAGLKLEGDQVQVISEKGMLLEDSVFTAGMNVLSSGAQLRSQRNIFENDTVHQSRDTQEQYRNSFSSGSVVNISKNGDLIQESISIEKATHVLSQAVEGKNVLRQVKIDSSADIQLSAKQELELIRANIKTAQGFQSEAKRLHVEDTYVSAQAEVQLQAAEEMTFRHLDLSGPGGLLAQAKRISARDSSIHADEASVSLKSQESMRLESTKIKAGKAVLCSQDLELEDSVLQSDRIQLMAKEKLALSRVQAQAKDQISINAPEVKITAAKLDVSEGANTISGSSVEVDSLESSSKFLSIQGGDRTIVQSLSSNDDQARIESSKGRVVLQGSRLENQAHEISGQHVIAKRNEFIGNSSTVAKKGNAQEDNTYSAGAVSLVSERSSVKVSNAQCEKVTSLRVSAKERATLNGVNGEITESLDASASDLFLFNSSLKVQEGLTLHSYNQTDIRNGELAGDNISIGGKNVKLKELDAEARKLLDVSGEDVSLLRTKLSSTEANANLESTKSFTAEDSKLTAENVSVCAGVATFESSEISATNDEQIKAEVIRSNNSSHVASNVSMDASFMSTVRGGIIFGKNSVSQSALINMNIGGVVLSGGTHSQTGAIIGNLGTLSIARSQNQNASMSIVNSSDVFLGHSKSQKGMLSISETGSTNVALGGALSQEALSLSKQDGIDFAGRVIEKAGFSLNKERQRQTVKGSMTSQAKKMRVRSSLARVDENYLLEAEDADLKGSTFKVGGSLRGNMKTLDGQGMKAQVGGDTTLSVEEIANLQGAELRSKGHFLLRGVDLEKEKAPKSEQDTSKSEASAEETNVIENERDANNRLIANLQGAEIESSEQVVVLANEALDAENATLKSGGSVILKTEAKLGVDGVTVTAKSADFTGDKGVSNRGGKNTLTEDLSYTSKDGTVVASGSRNSVGRQFKVKAKEDFLHDDAKTVAGGNVFVDSQNLANRSGYLKGEYVEVTAEEKIGNQQGTISGRMNLKCNRIDNSDGVLEFTKIEAPETALPETIAHEEEVSETTHSGDQVNKEEPAKNLTSEEQAAKDEEIGKQAALAVEAARTAAAEKFAREQSFITTNHMTTNDNSQFTGDGKGMLTTTQKRLDLKGSVSSSEMFVDAKKVVNHAEWSVGTGVIQASDKVVNQNKMHGENLHILTDGVVVNEGEIVAEKEATVKGKKISQGSAAKISAADLTLIQEEQIKHSQMGNVQGTSSLSYISENGVEVDRRLQTQGSFNALGGKGDVDINAQTTIGGDSYLEGKNVNINQRTHVAGFGQLKAENTVRYDHADAYFVKGLNVEAKVLSSKASIVRVDGNGCIQVERFEMESECIATDEQMRDTAAERAHRLAQFDFKGDVYFKATKSAVNKGGQFVVGGNIEYDGLQADNLHVTHEHSYSEKVGTVKKWHGCSQKHYDVFEEKQKSILDSAGITSIGGVVTKLPTNFKNTGSFAARSIYGDNVEQFINGVDGQGRSPEFHQIDQVQDLGENLDSKPFLNKEDASDSPYMYTGVGTAESSEIGGQPAEFLEKLGVTPENAKFLMDAQAEAAEIQNQAVAQTGRISFVSGLEDTNTQRVALCKNTLEFAEKNPGVTVGVALSEEQLLNVTEPMLWYVTKNVDGKEVLVPTVYLPKDRLDKMSRRSGAVYVEDNLAIRGPTGTFHNTGFVDAGGTVRVEMEKIINEKRVNQERAMGIRRRAWNESDTAREIEVDHVNAGGEIRAYNATFIAKEFTNNGGSVSAVNDLGIQADRVVNKALQTRGMHQMQGGNKTASQRLMTYSQRTEINSASLAAGNSLLIDAKDYLLNDGSSMVGWKKVGISAGEFEQKTVSSSYLDKSTKGQKRKENSYVTKHENGSITCFDGNVEVNVTKGDAVIEGSIGSHNGDVRINAKGSIYFKAHTTSVNNRKTTNSVKGLVGSSTSERWNETQTSVASVFANDIILTAGGKISGDGLQLTAFRDLAIEAQEVDMRAHKVDKHIKVDSTSVGVSFFGSEAINLMANKGSVEEAARALLKEDPAIQAAFELASARDGADVALGALTSAMTTWNEVATYNEAAEEGIGGVMSALDEDLGVSDPNVSVRVGESKSESNWQELYLTQFSVGRNMVCKAAKQRFEGVQIDVGNDAFFKGEDIEFSSAESKSSEKSTEHGVSVSGPTSVGVDASKSSQKSTSHTNSHVNVGGNCKFEADQLALRGANVNADTVSGTVGKLIVESRQDTSSSRQAGASVNSSGQCSANASWSDSKTTSEMSGIQAKKKSELTCKEVELTGGATRNLSFGENAKVTTKDLQDTHSGGSFSVSGNVKDLKKQLCGESSKESNSGQRSAMSQDESSAKVGGDTTAPPKRAKPRRDAFKTTGKLTVKSERGKAAVRSTIAGTEQSYGASSNWDERQQEMKIKKSSAGLMTFSVDQEKLEQDKQLLAKQMQQFRHGQIGLGVPVKVEAPASEKHRPELTPEEMHVADTFRQEKEEEIVDWRSELEDVENKKKRISDELKASVEAETAKLDEINKRIQLFEKIIETSNGMMTEGSAPVEEIKKLEKAAKALESGINQLNSENNVFLQALAKEESKLRYSISEAQIDRDRSELYATATVGKPNEDISDSLKRAIESNPTQEEILMSETGEEDDDLNHKVSLTTINKGKGNSDEVMFYTNGINTSYEEAVEMAKKFSIENGGVEVVCIYNPSYELSTIAVNCARNFCGGQSASSHVFQDWLIEQGQNGKSVFGACHSEGNLVVGNALSNMDLSLFDGKPIEILGIAPPYPIQKRENLNVISYAHGNDKVVQIGLGYAWIQDAKHRLTNGVENDQGLPSAEVFENVNFVPSRLENVSLLPGDHAVLNYWVWIREEVRRRKELLEKTHSSEVKVS
ncbi:MAG: adhesin HecA-like repeat protein [Chlamydiales bacterium]|jgi:adhesin HecA-like repeat protein